MRRLVRSSLLACALVAAVGAGSLGCRQEPVQAQEPTVGSQEEESGAQVRPTSVAGIVGYNLEQPDRLVQLPVELTEVSGLSDVSNTAVACVQDEVGTIFVYDLERQSIAGRIQFGAPGDYEGLTYVDKVFFVLRSDGRLFEVSGEWGSPEVQSVALSGPTRNHEGLGHDPTHGRLLVAAKSPPGKGKANKDRRVVYGFDLKRRQFLAEPVLDLDVGDVRAFARAHNVRLPSKTTKSGKTREFLRFLPASIAVHPKSGEYYILSASDRTLVVFSRSGGVLGLAVLPEQRFSQPEGVTFLPNGDMVITNEGKGGAPTLLLFHWAGEGDSR